MRCIIFHAHGNLFRDCLQNKKPGGKKDQENQDAEGFTRIPNKKRSAKKTMGPEIHKKVQNQNRFEALQEAKQTTT